MKHIYGTMLRGLLAGIMIAIAATGYLVVDNKYFAATIFAIGLFTIYFFGFYLYTGKVGYIAEKKNTLEVCVVYLSNIVGTILCGLLLLNTRIVETGIVEKTAELALHKIHDGPLSVLILSFFCGVLMFLAAEANNYAKATNNPIFGAVVIYLCVVTFLLAGFDHSIANTFYFTLGKAWSMHAVVSLIVATIGNALGGLFFCSCFMALKKDNTAH